jgi:signal transduction histidine kinase
MFSRLVRTTTFKLTLIFLVVFIVFSTVLIGYFAWNTRRVFTDQIVQSVQEETRMLADQYRNGGIRRLVAILDRRARRPGSSLYLLTTPAGETIAGNIASLPAGVLDRAGFVETDYSRLDDPDDAHRALVQSFQLPGGFRLLIGRDLEERDRLDAVIRRGIRLSSIFVIAFGLIGGVIVTRRVLRRIDRMTETTNAIVGTDLKNRLPLAGTGDELDRLAASTNTMLDRIEALMQGLKQVSDNIAHDLKTPLTRLRNRCEEALRGGGSPEDYRAALERTIEEADGLIATFNALLLIARTESGQGRQTMSPVDVGQLVDDVAELYQPVAEEKGASLVATVPTGLTLQGNRELLAQALANLLDNAVKYGVTSANGEKPVIRIGASASSSGIELTVADSGPGVAEADRARITDRFVRLDESRSEPGSGLGLSLVQAVARLHGGTLTFQDNRPGLKASLLIPAPPA